MTMKITKRFISIITALVSVCMILSLTSCGDMSENIVGSYECDENGDVLIFSEDGFFYSSDWGFGEYYIYNETLVVKRLRSSEDIKSLDDLVRKMEEKGRDGYYYYDGDDFYICDNHEILEYEKESSDIDYYDDAYDEFFKRWEHENK